MPVQTQLSNSFRIPLTRPFIDYAIKNQVMDTLSSGFLTEGKKNASFENTVAAYCDVPYAISMPNATLGLRLAIQILAYHSNRYRSDNNPYCILVPAFTHPATILAIVGLGFKAVLIDIDENTLLINPEQIFEHISSTTIAVLGVSLFGNPLNYEKLNSIKENYGIQIIEDAACSLGSKYNDLPTGSLADISVFSFHPRKIITTGEGGMITTRYYNFYQDMISLKNFGCVYLEKHPYYYLAGTNHKMSDIQASLGLAQMNILSSLIYDRRKLADNYRQLLSKRNDIKIQQETIGGRHVYQTFCILIENRNKVMEYMRQKGIEVQVGTHSIVNSLPKNFPPHLSNDVICRIPPVSDMAFKKSLALPLYNGMSIEEQEEVVDMLIKAMTLFS